MQPRQACHSRAVWPIFWLVVFQPFKVSVDRQFLCSFGLEKTACLPLRNLWQIFKKCVSNEMDNSFLDSPWLFFRNQRGHFSVFEKEQFTTFVTKLKAVWVLTQIQMLHWKRNLTAVNHARLNCFDTKYLLFFSVENTFSTTKITSTEKILFVRDLRNHATPH